jgi:hypothetical protein
VVIGAIDHRDRQAPAGQPARRGEPAEATADDDDARTRFHAAILADAAASRHIGMAAAA